MAPALSDATRKHPADCEPFPRRPALTSVGNLSPNMEDDMGLHSATNLSKDSQDMEQMLVELSGGELGQAELLQAIKTLESGADALSTGDADVIFPLSGFDRDELLEGGDSEGDAAEDKIRALQARLQRRMCFLQRRMRIHQARAFGKRVSDEAGQSLERCGRATRREGSGLGVRPAGLKSLLKRVETTATLQASAAARHAPGPSYYQPVRDTPNPSACLGVSRGTLAGLADTAAALRCKLTVVERQLDSDATLSSSGAESNDEDIAYTNLLQEPMPVERRALWHWQRRRASLAARWSWLQAQVQELEYKIRQHSDLHRQVRAAKGPVQFAGEVGGYEGPLPGAACREGGAEEEEAASCARARPLRRETFRKRKLLQMHNLHVAATKAAKPADIRCGCQWPIWGCAVCTGRAVATQPLPPPSTLAARSRLALLDPAYHPVLSDIHDVSPSIHMGAMCSRAWWATRARRAPGGRARIAAEPPPAHHAPPAHPQPTALHHHHSAHSAKKRKYSNIKRGRPSVGRKSRDTEDIPSHERGRVRGGGGGGGGGGAGGGGVPEPAGGASRRLNSSSYDIDNIVIPPSVAATTRLEILHYKEIPTPKWRVLDLPTAPLHNGRVRRPPAPPPARPAAAHPAAAAQHRAASGGESDEEDTSEASVLARHARAEQTERGKYARKKRTRRSNHQNSTESQQADGNGVNSLLSGEEESNPAPAVDLAPSAVTAPTAAADPPPPETVRPYSPRAFPLPDDAYWRMLQSMPQGHPLRAAASPAPVSPAPVSPAPVSPAPLSPTPTPTPTLTPTPTHDDDEEPLSPMSPLLYEDDPNDPEWDCEKEDNR